MTAHGSDALHQGKGYPSLTPREDRLLLYWYPENVRSLDSNREYLRLPLEAKGVLTALRHLFLHNGLLPNEPAMLAWQAREEDSAAFERWIPVIVKSGMFVATPDGAYLYDPALDAEIAEAADKVKALKQGGTKGGQKSGETRRRKKAGQDVEAPPAPAQNTAAASVDDSWPPTEIPF